MKKAFIILIIFIVLIISGLIVINANTVSVIETADLNNHTFSLSINKEGEELYGSENINAKYKYNTLMIPMDIVFSQIFENYNQESVEQTLTYNGTTLQINKTKNVITVPNVYSVSTSQIDDTVDVEIEVIDETKYIPIYLLTNISGIEVKIDNKQIYNERRYYNSIEAVKAKDTHTILIKIGEAKDSNELSSTEYVGEEDGALWREEALKRIEKYRKSDTNIIVKNQNNQIVDNANVNIKMNNNQFKFGTAIRMAETTKLNKYTGITRSLFNAVGSENGFKWSVLEQNGSQTPNDVINFAKENDMYTRGHCLWWDRSWADVSDLVGELENPEEGTMAYINTEYNNGNITDEEAELLIDELKNKFEEIVLNHIREEVTEFTDIEEWDVTNEVISNQYFKYFLYDEALLQDAEFASVTQKYIPKYIDNEDYYKFMAKCYDMAKENNISSKLVFNDNKINGDFNLTQITDTIRIINNIAKYTDNIDTLGVQYHVYNKYHQTPQTYYNQINNVLEQTGLTDAVVTEYDNYLASKKNSYTDAEKQEKADYLRDTLIACYSNPNISAFTFWVYNSGTGSFVQEEWDAYEELVTPWLNDQQSGVTDENGTYSTRAYNGEYTASVEVNGLTAEKTFTVSPETDTIEIIINSNPERLEIKQAPNKTQYIQGKEELDLTGGILQVYYDDGTVKELSLTDENIQISNMDNTTVGENVITVKHGELETSFTVEVIEDRIGNLATQILQNYVEFEQNYAVKLQGNQNAVETISLLKENMQILKTKTAIENSEELKQYANATSNVSMLLIENNINDEKVYSIINDTHEILELYESLNSLSTQKGSTIDTQEITANISTFEDKVNYYEDLNVSTIKDYIETAKTGIQNAQENSICAITAKFLADCSNKILNNYISTYLEANPVTVNYSAEGWTNQDVKVRLTAGEDQTIKITNSDDENSYTFSENGTYELEYTRRNITGKIMATVNWIDKQAPIIVGIEDEAVYTEQVAITITDENLDTITLTKDGQAVEFVNGGTITEEGEYKITATDKASNKTTYTFTYVNLVIPNYEIVDNKYIINIEPNTTVEQFLNNIKTDLNVSVESGDVQLVENEKIATGTTIKVANNLTYTIVVTGDITGDGNVDIADLVNLNMYSIGKETLEGEYLLAADINHNGDVNIGDLVRLNWYSIGKINTL